MGRGRLSWASRPWTLRSEKLVVLGVRSNPPGHARPITTVLSNPVSGLSAQAVAPSLSVLRPSTYVKNPREIAQYFLVMAMQVAIIALIFRPMESLWPVER